MSRVASQGAIEGYLRHHEGVLEGCYLVADRVAKVAREIALIDVNGPGGTRYQFGRGPSGVLASDINADHTPYGGRARSHANWSAPAEGGTGLFGPRRALVKAPTKPGGAKRMVFYIGQRKFAVTSHKGRHATHFMQRAGEAVAATSPNLTYRHYPEWHVVRL